MLTFLILRYYSRPSQTFSFDKNWVPSQQFCIQWIFSEKFLKNLFKFPQFFNCLREKVEKFSNSKLSRVKSSSRGALCEGLYYFDVNKRYFEEKLFLYLKLLMNIKYDSLNFNIYSNIKWCKAVLILDKS